MLGRRHGPLEPFEPDLVFASLFYVLSRSVHSLPGFLSACAKCYEDAGLRLPRGDMLTSFCHGLSRLFSCDQIKSSYALLKPELVKILANLDQSSFSDVVFGAWLLLSFLFCLRPQDSRGSNLRWSDISFFSQGGVQVIIRPGKGIGHHGKIPFSAPSCAGAWTNLPAWLRLLQAFFPPSYPLDRPVFARRLGRVSSFSSEWFVQRLRTKYVAAFGQLPSSKLSAYSLRRGGATLLAEMGASNLELRKHLRHKNFETTIQYVASLESRSRREELTRRAM